MVTKTTEHDARTNMNRDDFLRSIHIGFDANDPKRIEHYFPTEKSTALLSKLLSRTSERAFLVVAPYGSGKSLVGAYALHTIENRKDGKRVLDKLNGSVESIDSNLAEWQKDRIESEKEHGVVITLHGYVEQLEKELLKSAWHSFERLGEAKAADPIKKLLEQDSPTLLECLNCLKNSVQKASFDRVLILWDEFGRQLETLISEGRAMALGDLQTLAEFCSRQTNTPFSLGLFLHQGLLNYAKSLPQAVRREWKKVEGRFMAVDYVEDSKEIYRLIGEIVTANLPKRGKPKIAVFKDAANRLRKLGRFHGFKQKELVDLLRMSYPLTPATLELLPRIAARVSQNERTLFSYLFQIPDSPGEIGAESLFDYFSDEMQGDSEVGGTYRQWLETRSALSKVAGEGELEAALKITCLLGLGLAGERNHATREQVALAVAGYQDQNHGYAIIDELIERKLLLHRKHSDEVAVWHGVDLDLRGRLNEEKVNLEPGFDLAGFLRNEAPAPHWKPQEYNDAFAIRRFFTSDFITVDNLDESIGIFDQAEFSIREEDDGKIFYILSSTSEEMERGKWLLSKMESSDLKSHYLNRTVFVLPSSPLPLREAALEVACLIGMEQDQELKSEDPLVLPEIREMLDDARAHLQQLIDRLIVPHGQQTNWFYQGEWFQIESPRMLQRLLSNVMLRVFPETPKIQNELVVRKKPSAVVVNARKKLELAVLERCGNAYFGIEGNFPDASMCRTVLVQTGLYKENPETKQWYFVTPNAVENSGLREVWAILQEFFASPSKLVKSPCDLFDTLTAPPYGVRRGLLPILFTAGFKAFAYTTMLLRDGEYVRDVLPSDVESIFKEPDRYGVMVLDLEPYQVNYLEGVRKIFSTQWSEGAEEDLIRNTYDALLAWLRQLPGAALSTRRVSKSTAQFRSAISNTKNPSKLLLQDIPEILEMSDIGDDQKCFEALGSVKKELENVICDYREFARRAVLSALGSSAEEGRSAREVASTWSKCFYPALPPSHPGKPVLVRMQAEYDSDEKLVDSLAATTGRRTSLPRWEDEDLARFEEHLMNMVREIENSSLEEDLSKFRGSEAAQPLQELLRERLCAYAQKLQQVADSEEAEEVLREILDQSKIKK